jgi:hypothetical protein
MAKIYNSDCTKGLAKNAGIQQNIDKTPNELAEKIVPTFETNPELLRKTNVLAYSSSQNVTLYAIPAGKRFFLTGGSISMQKDANSDNTLLDIRTTAYEGASTSVLTIKSITATANAQSLSRTFEPPIECFNSVSFNATGTAAVLTTGCCIQGYLVDSQA